MGMPVIDTNLRFVKVPLDGDLSCLNFNDYDNDPDCDPTQTPLTSSGKVDAYAFRKRDHTLQCDETDEKKKKKKEHLHACSLTEFVRSYAHSFKQTTDGNGQKLYIYPRAKRFQQYSLYDR